MKKHVMMNLAVFAVLAGALVVSPPVGAQASSEEMRAEINRLKRRISQLEQQLGSRQMPVAPDYSSAWDPFHELEEMHRQMNRMFRDSFGRGFGAMAPGQSPLDAFDPDVDIQDTEDSYIVTMDIPGMNKDKIDIELKDGLLTVSGQRETYQEEDSGQFSRRERSFGMFSRSVAMPDDVDPGSIEAKYDKGVLKITVGRTGQKAVPKKIDVK